MTHDTSMPGGPASAGGELLALGQAGEHALQVIRQATASGDGGAVSAIEAVFLLDDALGQFCGWPEAVSALLTAARPGPAFEADVRAHAGELADLAAQVSAVRGDLGLVRTRERETSTLLSELSELREQVSELRRRERLASALHELNGQRQVVEQRLTLLRRLTEDQENAIAASAGEVITLAEERRDLLAPQVRDTLVRADQALRSLREEEERAQAEQARLDDAEQRLAAARQRQAELAAERDERLTQLAAHARADSMLAAALRPADPAMDPAGQLRAVLDGIITQLEEVDGALRESVNTRQSAYRREHATLGWTGQ